MKIKTFLGKILMSLTEGFIAATPASTLTVGAEQMPKSMKKLR